jgi:signal peptidase I
MAPVFRVDDAVIVNAKSDIAKLNPGDIITFTAFESEAVITHRITNKEITATGYEFRTKGDNNNVEDSFVTSQSRIIGKYVTRIPQIAVWLEGALAKTYIVALLVAAVLLIQFMLGTLEKKLNPVKEVIAAETQAEAQTETGGEGPQLVAEGQVAAEPVAGLQVAAEEQGTTEQPQQQTDALRQFQGIAESWNNGDGSASDEKNKS